MSDSNEPNSLTPKQKLTLLTALRDELKKAREQEDSDDASDYIIL